MSETPATVVTAAVMAFLGAIVLMVIIVPLSTIIGAGVGAMAGWFFPETLSASWPRWSSALARSRGSSARRLGSSADSSAGEVMRRRSRRYQPLVVRGVCHRCGRCPVPMDTRMQDHCMACAIHVRCGPDTRRELVRADAIRSGERQ